MKRKKSRHKQAAVDFLSNISLEGYPNVTPKAKQCSSLTTAALNATEPIHHHHGNQTDAIRKTQLFDATNIQPPRSTPYEQTLICDKCTDSPLDKLLDRGSNQWLQLKGYNYENACPRKINSNITCDVNTSSRDSFITSSFTPIPSSSRASDLETNTSGAGITGVASPKQEQWKSVVSDSSLRDILSVKSSGIKSLSVKCLVISSGLRQSVRSLFSVIPHTRRISTASNRIGHRANNAPGAGNTTLDIPSIPSHCNGGVSCSTIHRSVSNMESLVQHPLGTTGLGKAFIHNTISPANSFISDSVRNASIANQTSFVRPTGDEVISVATFLRQCYHHSLSTSWSSVPRQVHSQDTRCCHQLPLALCCSDLGCLEAGGGGDPNAARVSWSGGLSARPFPIACEEVVSEVSGLNQFDVAGGREHRPGKLGHATSSHQPPGSLLPCTAAHQSRFPTGSLRTRLDSAGRRGGGSPAGRQSQGIPTAHPAPLLRYLPNLLDDPDLLVATGKRFMQLPGYLTTLLTYVRPSEQKRNVNLEFHLRFPSVQLTLTKLRSLKADIVRTVHKLSFDLWIAAHAHVLFEKMVLKLLVNKLNRKAYSSAALLISAKLNDIKGPDLSALIQETENMFRVSHRDLLHAEVEVFFSLEFYVIPSDSDILPHYLRIHRDIDVAPLVPNGCINRNLLQLTFNSMTDVVVSQK